MEEEVEGVWRNAWRQRRPAGPSAVSGRPPSGAVVSNFFATRTSLSLFFLLLFICRYWSTNTPAPPGRMKGTPWAPAQSTEMSLSNRRYGWELCESYESGAHSQFTLSSSVFYEFPFLLTAFPLLKSETDLDIVQGVKLCWSLLSNSPPPFPCHPSLYSLEKAQFGPPTNLFRSCVLIVSHDISSMFYYP